MSEPNGVKRYDLDNSGNGWETYGIMLEAPDGDWVLYQEYENLQREHDKLHRENKHIKSLLSKYRKPGRY